MRWTGYVNVPRGRSSAEVLGDGTSATIGSAGTFTAGIGGWVGGRVRTTGIGGGVGGRVRTTGIGGGVGWRGMGWLGATGSGEVAFEGSSSSRLSSSSSAVVVFGGALAATSSLGDAPLVGVAARSLAGVPAAVRVPAAGVTADFAAISAAGVPAAGVASGRPTISLAGVPATRAIGIVFVSTASAFGTDDAAGERGGVPPGGVGRATGVTFAIGELADGVAGATGVVFASSHAPSIADSVAAGVVFASTHSPPLRGSVEGRPEAFGSVDAVSAFDHAAASAFAPCDAGLVIDGSGVVVGAPGFARPGICAGARGGIPPAVVGELA